MDEPHDVHLDGFEDPWEHLRLLSDPERNAALVALLVRHAPGRSVLEVGCGTGLLSLVAARAGARRVIAVEPTGLADVARALVRDNGLDAVIDVRQARIQDVAPEPVDLAFSELLNADPFYEGVVPAMRAAARWTGAGGRLVPRRLRVWVALVAAPDSAREARVARRQIASLGQRFGLQLGALDDALGDPPPYRYFTTTEPPVSAPALAWDLALGTDDEPDEIVDVEVTASRAGPVGGATVWFEAELDDASGDAPALAMSNGPGDGERGHWGRLVCAWSHELAVRDGERVGLTLTLDDGEIDVEPG